MIAYIKGKIVKKNLDSIIVENNNIGYRIYFSQLDKVCIDDTVCIYTYQHVREDEFSLYGFLSSADYDLFIRLISVKGLGPKTAMNAFKVSNTENIIRAIETNDVAYIKKLPGVGAKTASQIILDLKGKLVQEVQEVDSMSQEISDALEGLKSLGYKNNEVSSLVKELSKHQNLTSDEYLKFGLQLLMKRKIGG